MQKCEGSQFSHVPLDFAVVIVVVVVRVRVSHICFIHSRVYVGIINGAEQPSYYQGSSSGLPARLHNPKARLLRRAAPPDCRPDWYGLSLGLPGIYPVRPFRLSWLYGQQAGPPLGRRCIAACRLPALTYSKPLPKLLSFPVP